MRLIDADALMEWVYRERLDTRERIANLVERMPTIDPVKHGKWIRLGAAKYRCGECGKVQYGDRGSDLHFCCNCGAKMDGGKDDPER